MDEIAFMGIFFCPPGIGVPGFSGISTRDFDLNISDIWNRTIFYPTFGNDLFTFPNPLV
jgi:hypothetical protein